MSKSDKDRIKELEEKLAQSVPKTELEEKLAQSVPKTELEELQIENADLKEKLETANDATAAHLSTLDETTAANKEFASKIDELEKANEKLRQLSNLTPATFGYYPPVLDKEGKVLTPERFEGGVYNDIWRAFQMGSHVPTNRARAQIAVKSIMVALKVINPDPENTVSQPVQSQEG